MRIFAAVVATLALLVTSEACGDSSGTGGAGGRGGASTATAAEGICTIAYRCDPPGSFPDTPGSTCSCMYNGVPCSGLKECTLKCKFC